jgi:hypothetical protein
MWPKEDHNRALVASARSNSDYTIPDVGNYQWINVVPTDMRLHLATSSLLGDSQYAGW